MSTFTAILEADADGTLHVPLPRELQNGRVRIVATLERDPLATEIEKGTPLDALKQLRTLGGVREKIADPVAWQKEQRAERPLPGRE